jgi:predicted nucleotidyltransferase
MKMIQLDEIKIILENHKAEIIERFKVKEIGVFGSFVKNLQNKESDLDILVDYLQPVSFFQFLELEEYLESLFHMKVDLVSKTALKPKIGEQILQEIAYI